MKSEQIGTEATKKNANGLRTAGKASQAYWLEKLKKRADFWGAAIMFKGERHYLTFTQDKYDSAKRAGAAYKTLLSDGWPVVLAQYSRIDREPEPDKLTATVGNYIEAAQAVAMVKERTFRDYCIALRMIVSEIAAIEKTKSRFAASRGAKAFRAAVDEIPLAEITPARVAAWQKARLDGAGDDQRKQRSAKTSANSYLRQAASLFGKRILPLVAERLDVPNPPPFAGVTPFKAPSARYQSAIDPAVVLQRATDELAGEPLKVMMLGLVAGLRAGEIDGLRWSQVNLDAGEIRIETTETFGAKSEDSIGTVEIDPGFVALLRGWKAKATGPFVVEVATANLPKWRHAYRANGHFQAVYSWLRELEIDGETPLNVNKPLHTLRKEAGSLVNQRHGLAAASMFLRHADIGITARYYVGKKERHTTGLFPEPENVTRLNADSPKSAKRRKDTRHGG